MKPLLANKAAVVTGGASGIGRAIATTFATAGADIVIADIREEPREDGVPTHERICEETDVEATFCECDVTSMDNMARAIDAADDFGGLDIMVNNAGILGPMGPITDIDLEDYRKLLSVNLEGVFIGSKLAATRLIEQGTGGSIVNVSSIAGIQGYSHMSPYCSAKAGVRNVTYSLADELGPHGIRVNAVHPGPIETAMTGEDLPSTDSGQTVTATQAIPLNKVGQPEDVANGALFLASDLASHITAESLLVDGGELNTN